MNPKIHYQHGFSLLEILVAFTILALSLGVLYQIFGQGTQAAILMNDYTQAVIIAESKLAGVGTETGALMNDSGIENDTYHWSLSLVPYTKFEQSSLQTGAHLYEVMVSVTWESLGKEHKVDLHSLRLFAEQ